nr:putative ATP-dependent RNA helicase TDRD12 [Parasteatoda tepidariorum]
MKRDMEEAYIEVKGVEKNMLVGSLYVTLCDGEVICVNDELIGKQFARAYPDSSELIITLENFVQQRSRPPTPCAKLPIYSSAESISSTSSSKSFKDVTSKGIVENCEPRKKDISNNQVGRRMTGRIAVDMDELNREKDVFSQVATNQVPKSNKKISQLDKYRQIKSFLSARSDVESVKSHESSVDLECSDLSLPESFCSSEGANDFDKKWSETSSTERDNKDTDRSHIKSPSQNAHSKLDTIKKFLLAKRKSTSPNLKCNSQSGSASFPPNQNSIVETPKEDVNNRSETTNQNTVSLEKFVKSVMSDVDDPDDLLQCALDPDKRKNISSETESSSSSSPRKLSVRYNNNCEANVSFDFGPKAIWEKFKVPAKCIGEAIPNPVLSVDETTFTSAVRKILETINFYGPSSIQSVVWPSMNRSRNLAAIAPPHSGKTVGYLLPLVSNMTDGFFYSKIPKGKGPLAIILCSSWKKVQAVYEYFCTFGALSKLKIVTFFADGISKRAKITTLTSGCDVIISVPSSLLELFKEKAVDISRCCHFILDDGNILLSQQIEKVTKLMLTFVESIRSRVPLSVSLQIIVCAERWTKSISAFVEKFMNNPILLFTSFLEWAIYAQIPMFGHVCFDNKNDKLVEILQNAVRTIICTSDKEAALEVHSHLKFESIRSFLVTDDMEHYISKEVIKDWKSVQFSSVPNCLVITDAALIDMPVSNANHLIHYDIPELSRSQFGNRFGCVVESSTTTDYKSDCSVHILISQECSYQAAALLKIISRSGVEVSKELKIIASKQPKILKSSDVSLCSNFKAYGKCGVSNCESRHHIDSVADRPSIIPKEGDIQCLITHVFDATHYYVRLLKYISPSEENPKHVSMSATYAKIGFMLKKFYSMEENQIKVNSVKIGEQYVLEDKNKLFYRVKVLNITESPKEITFGFQDEGWVKTYTNCQLYYQVSDLDLPAPVAAEVYLCGMTPPDSCLDWNFQASHFIHKMIFGKEVHGKIVLCLDNTLWLNPIVLREKLIFANDYLNLMTVSKELKDYGYAVENKQHIPLLHKACEGIVSFPKIADTSTQVNVYNEPEQTEIFHAFLELNLLEDVYVSSVVSPHQFYVQREKFVDCLDKLLDKIDEFRQNHMLKKCKTFQKGMHCIAPFSEDNRYYRAEVIDILLDKEEVQLFYVDFGDTGYSKISLIYNLLPEFLLLPFQAIECELDGVQAVHGGWTDKTTDSFYNLTRDNAGDMKVLSLKAYSKSPSYTGGNHYVVDLWNGEKSLSDQLLETGLVEEKERVSSSISFPVEEEKKEEYWDDIPPGYNVSSSDEELDTDEKDDRALFCVALAKLMLVGDQQLSKEQDSAITELLKNVDLKKPCDLASMTDNNHLKVAENIDDRKACDKTLSPLDSIRKLMKTRSKCRKKILKPHIVWWDTKEKVNMTIMMKDLKIYEIDINDNGFSFKSSTNTADYFIEEAFFSKVLSKENSSNTVPAGLHISIFKAEHSKWPRLIQKNLKCPYIKYDFDHLDDSDSEDPVPERSYVQRENVEVLPCEDDEEDKEFSDDEETYVQPWKHLAEYKDPFDPLH